MLDYLKQTLEVGDKVVYIMPGYREFQTGVVERFTPRNVIISTGRDGLYGPHGTIKQESHQLLKIANHF